MSFSKSSPKRTASTSSDEELSFDLYYQLVYMMATASSGISRNRVFALGSDLASVVADCVRDIETLVRTMHYDYPTACRIVGDRTSSRLLKSFLLRLSDALDSGEPIRDFLTQEAHVQADSYENQYERDLESLKKWTDAYASLVVSQALIIIISLISTMIYNVGAGMTAGLVLLAIMMSFFGVWVLSRAAPKEQLIIAPPEGSQQQIRYRKLSLLSLGAATLVGLVSRFAGAGWPLTLTLLSLIMAPLGVLSFLCDRNLAKKEEEIGPFLRSLGNMATSTGTTLTEALKQLDLQSFPTLAADIGLLRTRLNARSDPQLSWRKFGQETGSDLIHRAARIFYDAISLGGDPDEIGAICAAFSSKVAMLRARRRIVASSFNWLTLLMHGALSALMVLVLEIVLSFRSLIETIIDPQQAQQAMQSIDIPLLRFNTGHMSMLSQITIAMVLVLIAANALAIVTTDGGFKPKFLLWSAIMMLLSAVSFGIVPAVVHSIMWRTISG
ncbi:MAG: type II secretion system F family protein [Chloroflexi bacterium]|nr:type II secretion system F family protein [Chloroflexota bacterium]